MFPKGNLCPAFRQVGEGLCVCYWRVSSLKFCAKVVWFGVANSGLPHCSLPSPHPPLGFICLPTLTSVNNVIMLPNTLGSWGQKNCPREGDRAGRRSGGEGGVRWDFLGPGPRSWALLFT